MKNPRIILKHGKALDFLQTLPDESVDLMITDPPWASLEAHRAIGTTTRLKDWFPVLEEGDLHALLVQAYRVLRPDRHAYIVSDWASLRMAVEAAEYAGFKVWTPLIWDKVLIGMGYHWRATWEAILFLEKGKRKLRDLSKGNVLHVPRPPKPIWPCEKPVALWSRLVRNSLPTLEEMPRQLSLLEAPPLEAYPWVSMGSSRRPERPMNADAPADTDALVGEEGPMLPVVLDPYMGSGSSAVAAIMAGADYIGCDVQEKAFELTKARIVKAASDLAAIAAGHGIERPPEGRPHE
jgi:site-specific DNA-methyltransferase (adenine-specific)